MQHYCIVMQFASRTLLLQTLIVLLFEFRIKQSQMCKAIPCNLRLTLEGLAELLEINLHVDHHHLICHVWWAYGIFILPVAPLRHLINVKTPVVIDFAKVLWSICMLLQFASVGSKNWSTIIKEGQGRTRGKKRNLLFHRVLVSTLARCASLQSSQWRCTRERCSA